MKTVLYSKPDALTVQTPHYKNPSTCQGVAKHNCCSMPPVNPHSPVLMAHNNSYLTTGSWVAVSCPDLMVMEAVSYNGPRASQQSRQGMFPAGT